MYLYVCMFTGFVRLLLIVTTAAPGTIALLFGGGAKNLSKNKISNNKTKTSKFSKKIQKLSKIILLQKLQNF